MGYRNVEKILRSIELRPLMYIPEERISFLYSFLTGYIGCALSANVAEEIDKVFKKEFSHWTEQWLILNLAIDFSNDCLSWYKMYQKASETDEGALELFFKSSQEFFADFHKNKR